MNHFRMQLCLLWEWCIIAIGLDVSELRLMVPAKWNRPQAKNYRIMAWGWWSIIEKKNQSLVQSGKI